MERRDVGVPQSEMAEIEARDAAGVRTEMVESEMAERKVDSAFSWANLPPDVVIEIAGRLRNLDFFAMREVCSSWRRPVSFRPRPILSRFLPVTIPGLEPRLWELDLVRRVRANCVLSTGSVYVLRPPSVLSSSSQSAGFFLLFAEEFQEGRLWLRNPLSRALVSELPYQMNNRLNLLDFEAVEVAKCYSISSVPIKSEGGKRLPPFKLLKQIIKVVVLSNGCSAVALSDTGMLRVLNLLEPQWGVLHDAQRFKFDDIVEFDGKVLGVDRRGKVYSVEYNGLAWEMTVVGRQISGSGPGGGRRKRLVVSSGDLYLLVRCLGSDVRLKVFRLKVADHQWVRETHLGDQTFFVGVDLSFPMSTEGLGGHIIKNCVLFTEESFPCYHSMGRFYPHKSREDDLRLGVFSLDEGEGADLVAPRAYTNIFWPPPFWLHPKLSPIHMLQSGARKLDSRIQEAVGNPHKIGYFKQQFLDYMQFFRTMERLIGAEINAAKQSLLESSSNLQDKVVDLNCGVEENDGHRLSDVELSILTRDRSEALKEVHGLIQHAFHQFQIMLLK